MKTGDQTTPNEDPAWDLLENASHQTADPMFARNVMRTIRVDAVGQRPIWWKFRPAIAGLGLLTCGILATVAVRAVNPPEALDNHVADVGPASPSRTLMNHGPADEFDQILDPLLLVTYTEESNPPSLEELGL